MEGRISFYAIVTWLLRACVRLTVYEINSECTFQFTDHVLLGAKSKKVSFLDSFWHY